MKLLTKQLFSSILLLSLVALTFSACKKSDDPSPSGSSGSTSGKRFVKAKIGTQNINYTENGTTTIGDRGAGGLTEGQNTWLEYSGSVLNPFQGVNNSFYLQVGHIEVTNGATKPTDADFNSFFSIGSKNYTSTTDEKTFDGVMLLWIDENGDHWTTIGDQTGSTFTVTQATRFSATANSNAKVYWNATFNCTLYGDSGQTKTVTNGSLYLMFENMEKLN